LRTVSLQYQPLSHTPVWHLGCDPSGEKEEAMAKRILVALDHATPPDVLLDLVSDAARAGGASIRLVHVASVPESVVDDDGRVLAYADQEAARLEAEGLDMLRTTELHFADVPVDSVVRFGEASAEILREAEAFEADLIAMATRCRTGISRLLIGSVAEQVARRAPMAVALVRAPAYD
jgi:nucleotide-binding universal stress UspA family protein